MCCCIKEVKDKTNADSEIGSHIKKQLSENPIYSYMAGLDRIEFLSMKLYLLLAFFFFNQKWKFELIKTVVYWLLGLTSLIIKSRFGI